VEKSETVEKQRYCMAHPCEGECADENPMCDKHWNWISRHLKMRILTAQIDPTRSKQRLFSLLNEAFDNVTRIENGFKKLREFEALIGPLPSGQLAGSWPPEQDG
jgi:hypothetical protein